MRARTEGIGRHNKRGKIKTDMVRVNWRRSNVEIATEAEMKEALQVVLSPIHPLGSERREVHAKYIRVRELYRSDRWITRPTLGGLGSTAVRQALTVAENILGLIPFIINSEPWYL